MTVGAIYHNLCEQISDNSTVLNRVISLHVFVALCGRAVTECHYLTVASLKIVPTAMTTLASQCISFQL